MTNHSGVGIELHDHLSRASCDTQTTDFAISLREEIAPRGLLESLIFEQILTAVEEARSNDGTLDSTTVRKAERKLASGLRSLLDLRLIRANTATRPGFERDIDGNRGHWQDRLSWESSISEASPTIRGTWITVDQVVSRIVDGWSWIDILRAHPELSENDIRACLSYSVEENSMG